MPRTREILTHVARMRKAAAGEALDYASSLQNTVKNRDNDTMDQALFSDSNPISNAPSAKTWDPSTLSSNAMSTYKKMIGSARGNIPIPNLAAGKPITADFIDSTDNAFREQGPASLNRLPARLGVLKYLRERNDAASTHYPYDRVGLVNSNYGHNMSPENLAKLDATSAARVPSTSRAMAMARPDKKRMDSTIGVMLQNLAKKLGR